MHILKLHEHLEYLDQTAEFLNSHWKKGLDTRLSLLKQSNDNLPINFIGVLEGELCFYMLT